MLDPFNDRVYQLYYAEVGKHPILSAKEERQLLIRYHTCPHCNRQLPPRVKVTNCSSCGVIAPTKSIGRIFVCENCGIKFDVHISPKLCPHCGSARDIAARQKLVESNLRFVIRRAKRITTNPEHLRKLVSAGNVGLMLAVDKFCLSRNTRFLTYAEWWIRKEMLDEIHASSFIRVPPHRQKSIRRDQKEGRYVCRFCGARTDTPDHTFHSDCTEEDHDFALPLHNDASVLNDTIPIDDMVLAAADNIEENAIDSDVRIHLREALWRMDLSERDRFIIIGYFNIPQSDRKSESKSLHQLAVLTGITPERVRQIKEQTLEVLKKELKKTAVSSVDALA